MKLLTADWRNLAIVTYEIDPEAIGNQAPPGLVLDLWQGKCLVSLIGLQFLKSRALGVPVPFFGSFSEVNLRFYVQRESASEPRRGVVFIKQIVPYRSVAAAARRIYHERFIAMKVTCSLRMPPGEDQPRSVEYQWNGREGKGALEVSDLQSLGYPQPESIEEFVTERYWGYNAQPDGSTLEYLVDHPRWRVQIAESYRIEGDIGEVFGPVFAGPLKGVPVCALLAEGAPTAIYQGTKLQ